jgi:alkanesulfonate monooxygenase SsuD/methylene tetrahydromethanopterin reductase-like flavin-dependent oxidoreductase (luciferase family)
MAGRLEREGRHDRHADFVLASATGAHRGISVCGDREMCAGAVRRLAEAGADTIVLAAQGGDLEPQLERFAREIMRFLTGP